MRIAGARSRGALLLWALACLLVPRVAAADAYDDVERRLKTTGVSVELARDITRAIRSGAEYLRSVQAADGAFDDHAGATALAGLALLHTGDHDAHEAAEQALRRVRAWRQVPLGRTYEAGITAMLLQGISPRDPMLADLQSRLARGATGEGYWGYRAMGSSGDANLSTSQFACLGLWAAERSGLEREERTWRLHADGLFESQDVDGSWGYWPGARSIGHTYPNGTFMGLADLSLATSSHPPEDRRDLEMWYRDRWALRAGRVALARHVRWALGRGAAPIGSFPFYSYYAIEKACLFADVEDPGGIDWYAAGARTLLAGQLENGRFGGRSVHARNGPGVVLRAEPSGAVPSSVPMSFALLFLLRASEVYRPITPRDLPVPVPSAPVPAAPVTPGPEVEPPAPPEPEPAADPEPEAKRLPLPLAMQALDRLEAASRRVRMEEVEEIVGMLDFVARTFDAYVEDGAAVDTLHDAWVRRAEELLVPLAVPVSGSTVEGDPWRLLLAAEALDTLSHGTARGGALVLERLPPVALQRAGHRRLGIAYYHALFEALRRVRVPEFGAWLLKRAIDSDGKTRPMTIPALLALERIEGTPEERRRLAVLLLRRMRALEGEDNPLGSEWGLAKDTLHAVRCLVDEDDGEAFFRPGNSLRAWRRRLR